MSTEPPNPQPWPSRNSAPISRWAAVVWSVVISRTASADGSRRPAGVTPPASSIWPNAVTQGRGGDVDPRIGVVDPVHRHLVNAQPGPLREHEQFRVEEPARVRGERQQRPGRVGADRLEPALLSFCGVHERSPEILHGLRSETQAMTRSLCAALPPGVPHARAPICDHDPLARPPAALAGAASPRGDSRRGKSRIIAAPRRGYLPALKGERKLGDDAFGDGQGCRGGR